MGHEPCNIGIWNSSQATLGHGTWYTRYGTGSHATVEGETGDATWGRTICNTGRSVYTLPPRKQHHLLHALLLQQRHTANVMTRSSRWARRSWRSAARGTPLPFLGPSAYLSLIVTVRSRFSVLLVLSFSLPFFRFRLLFSVFTAFSLVFCSLPCFWWQVLSFTSVLHLPALLASLQVCVFSSLFPIISFLFLCMFSYFFIPVLV